MNRPNVFFYAKKVFLTGLFCLILFHTQGYLSISAASGLNVTLHTQEEIRQIWNTYNVRDQSETIYSRMPVNTAPYDCGAVSMESLQKGLNALNFVRYVAGIPYGVQIKEEYQALAQGAALINCVLGSLSHTPPKPAYMSDELYDLCYEGSSSSNLGMGYSNLYDAIVNGWMSDGDSGNIDRIGHRRWCLNPTMQYTGFGVDSHSYAMYSFDGCFDDNGYNGVVWPAQNMPLELFSSDDPWSISVGSEVDMSSVSVTLRRIGDGRIWHFSAGGSEGYFNVNNANYGQTGCIIFRPMIDGYKEGDCFEVTVTSTTFNASYQVNFFYLHDHIGGKATCQERAKCDICGEPYGELGSHDFSARWTIDKEATATEEGSKSRHCKTYGCTEKTDIAVIPKKETALGTQKISGIPKKLQIQTGKKYTLKPKLTPASSSDKVTYKSSNKKVVAVSKRGVLTAKKAGTAKITVKSGTKKCTLTVKVTKAKTESIKGVPATIKLKRGARYTLKPRLSSKSKSGRFTYSVSNKKIVTVSSKGIITGKKKGTAIVTIKLGKSKVKCKVSVK